MIYRGSLPGIINSTAASYPDDDDDEDDPKVHFLGDLFLTFFRQLLLRGMPTAEGWTGQNVRHGGSRSFLRERSRCATRF